VCVHVHERVLAHVRVGGVFGGYSPLRVLCSHLVAWVGTLTDSEGSAGFPEFEEQRRGTF
jgi:hypothetical protein